MRAKGLKWLALGMLWGPAGAQAGPPIDIFAGEPEEVEGDEPPVPPSKVIIDTGQGPELGGGSSSVVIETGRPAQDGARGVRMKVPVRRQGTAMFVEVEIGGKRALMMVDTGASLTTLTPAFATSLGLLPGPGAPKLEFQTANGRVQSPLGMIKALKLGSQQVRRVTFGVCESCGGKLPGEASEVVGLLGMNVLGRFRMKVDTGAKELELESNLGTSDTAADLSPWLAIKLTPSPRPPKKAQKEKRTGFLSLEVKNRAPYAIRQLVLSLQCVSQEEGRVEFKSDPVDLGATKTKQVPIHTSLQGACEEANVEVAGGQWE